MNFFKIILCLLIYVGFIPLKYGQAQDTESMLELKDFRLPTFQGTTYVLSEQKNYAGYVFAFISSRCPSSVAYNRRLVEIWEQCKNTRIDFQFVFVDEEEPTIEIENFMTQLKFPISALDDRKRLLTKMINVKVIPEIFLFSKNKILVYRGRIDDNQREKAVIRKDFQEAMAEYLVGKEKITSPQMIARGCKIK